MIKWLKHGSSDKHTQTQSSVHKCPQPLRSFVHLWTSGWITGCLYQKSHVLTSKYLIVSVTFATTMYLKIISTCTLQHVAYLKPTDCVWLFFFRFLFSVCWQCVAMFRPSWRTLLCDELSIAMANPHISVRCPFKASICHIRLVFKTGNNHRCRSWPVIPAIPLACWLVRDWATHQRKPSKSTYTSVTKSRLRSPGV